MTQIKAGSLKGVLLALPEDRSAVTRDLIERIGEDNVRAYGTAAILLHTDEAAATVRDWIRVGSAGGGVRDVVREWGRRAARVATRAGALDGRLRDGHPCAGKGQFLELE
jgi:hypothetical protein